jgi:Flp pilus assembly pilin Flp
MNRVKLIPMQMYLALQNMRDDESGQAMVEYALILALVSVASVGILLTLGGHVASIFSKIDSGLTS